MLGQLDRKTRKPGCLSDTFLLGVPRDYLGHAEHAAVAELYRTSVLAGCLPNAEPSVCPNHSIAG